MKILLDENMPRKLLAALATDDHEVNSVESARRLCDEERYCWLAQSSSGLAHAIVNVVRTPAMR